MTFFTSRITSCSRTEIVVNYPTTTIGSRSDRWVETSPKDSSPRGRSSQYAGPKESIAVAGIKKSSAIVSCVVVGANPSFDALRRTRAKGFSLEAVRSPFNHIVRHDCRRTTALLAGTGKSSPLIPVGGGSARTRSCIPFRLRCQGGWRVELLGRQKYWTLSPSAVLS